MIRWLWSKIMKWGWDFGREKQMEVVDLAVPSSSRGGDPIVRISLHHAMNGKILEIATPINTHHDWKYEHYIVTEGENLTDALAMLLIAKGIK